jgi:bifunctional non-homologous end joining protein LigD
MTLRAYSRKRDFSRTSEPSGIKKTKGGESNRFVVQKHDASRLHYDFRLEMGGTLKSWAVPRGIPFRKGEKHLAVQVEDHPIEYADFEGVIPEGEYGGGTVMVWDLGTYDLIGSQGEKEFASGKLHFVLHGKKLVGEWTLVQMRREDDQWLLIKSGEDVRPVSKKRENESALSGRTMRQIGAGSTA